MINIFKKKDQAPGEKSENPEEKKIEKKIEKIEKKAEKAAVGGSREKKGTVFTYRILKSPRITEKATDLGDLNQYTFNVSKDANKSEIKKAVQGLYGVDVVALRIINVPRKQRMFKGKAGWAEGGKKAIVKIKEGQKIEVLPR